MKNTNAQKIVKNYRIKCVLLAMLYAVGVAICIAIIGKNTLLGIACTVVLAASIKAPFDKLLEKDIESVIYEDLDPELFEEILSLGVLKKFTRHKFLALMYKGDHDGVLSLIAETETKPLGPIDKCQNLYRRGFVEFERGEFDKLAETVAEFKQLKAQHSKLEGIFNNFTVFDKFDAFVDEDYEYVVDVCDLDLRHISKKNQNHNVTKLNVSFYRAVALYKLERFEEAKEAFEGVIEFAPKTHKATLSKEYLAKIK